MRVAFLEVGRRVPTLSAAVSRAGHQIVAWDAPGSDACRMEVAAIVRVPTLAKALAGVDAVLSFGPGDKAVHDLVMRQGLLDHMTTETVHVILTRASVPTIRHVTEMHAAKRQHFVSAPLFEATGPTTAAAMVAAGDAEAVRRIKPLLDVIAPCIVVGAAPWHANLVSLGISRLVDGGSGAEAEAHAIMETAGIPLDLFRRAARLVLRPGDGGTEAAGAGLMPAGQPVLHCSADLADQT